MSRDPIDIRDHMKPPKSVREFMDRALADPKERRAIEKLTDKMCAEQDAPRELKICSRCKRKSGFTSTGSDERPDRVYEWVSDCCGWPGVDPSDAVDATEGK